MVLLQNLIPRTDILTYLHIFLGKLHLKGVTLVCPDMELILLKTILRAFFLNTHWKLSNNMATQDSITT